MPPFTSGLSASCGSRHAGETTAKRFTERIDVEACRCYTLTRQTSQGGFCFYAYPEWGVEEPNALDTYAAAAILRLLNSPMPRAEQCEAWLEAEQDVTGGYATLVIGYSTLMALRLLGSEPRRDPRPFLREMAARLGLADPLRPKRSGWLVASRHCIELWRAYEIIVTEPVREGIAAALAGLRGVDGGYGTPGSNLPETAAALALEREAGLSVNQDILAYARRCEAAPYGFNITPSSVSSGLEIHHAGLQVLRHFGQRPKDAMSSHLYVASCQSPSGGFGRRPRAIPRLDDSLRALQILAMLGGLGSARVERAPTS